MAHSDSEGDVMQSLIKAAERAEAGGSGLPPVEKWEPDHCGKMDLVIKRDGSWWHEGTRITRERLVRLFSTILRKDADEKTYLVTPGEKIEIEVEAAPFIAVRADISGEGQDQRVAFLTNFDDAVVAGRDHPIRVGEPEPYVHVRGRLEALINRATFYDLAEWAVEGEDEAGRKVMGLWSGGVFFPLGPKA